MEGTPVKVAQTSSSKRNLDQISPETPSSKRQLTNSTNAKEMDTRKVADLGVGELELMLAPLAKKADIEQLESTIATLQEENKALSDKVDLLSDKCQRLENEMQSVYLWKNSSNLIIKMDKARGEVEEAKDRLVYICGEITKEAGIVDKSSIRQLRTGDNRKYLFKVFLKDADKAAKIIRSTAALKGTDISVSKDYPKSIRDQQTKLLMVRRFLMRKSNCKPKLQGATLVEGTTRFSWSMTDGLVVNSGESLEEVLLKYQQTKNELDIFLSNGVATRASSSQGGQ